MAYDRFHVEFKDKIPTNRRKFITCSHSLQCKSTTTVSMMNHWKKFSTKNNNPNQPDFDNAIQIQRTSSSQVHHGQLEAAALVYEDHFPIRAVANSKTLNKWYHRMKFPKITFSSLNEHIKREYHRICEAIRDLISNRNKRDFLCISYDKWYCYDRFE